MKIFLILVSSLAISIPALSEDANSFWKPVSVQLVDYRLKTSAVVTITGVAISPSINSNTVTVFLTYKNTGKTTFTWEFGAVALVNAKGRQYSGLASTNPRSLGQFRNFIYKLQPGMEINNHVYFKVPREAFKGNLSFCFINEANNEPQGHLKIFDKKASTYNFKESTSFKSSAWK